MAQMNEMAVWDGTPEPARAMALEGATRLVAWARRLGSQAHPAPRPKMLGRRLVCRIEAANQHLLDRMDKSILRQLDSLRVAGMARPLIPLYVATWKQAQRGEMQESEETAVLLLMFRIQGTAQLAVELNANPSDQETWREMQKRGLLK